VERSEGVRQGAVCLLGSFPHPLPSGCADVPQANLEPFQSDALAIIRDISAKQFVTTKQQSADAIHNTESVFEATHSHAPKLRLGETHVPVDFLPEGEKTLPVVMWIGYARY
jgi:hypothetical protein